MADDVGFIPATRLLALYRKKQLSPVEIVQDALRRLKIIEGAVNAFVLYDPETALSMAHASETRWHKGEPLGLLDGVPVALKDTLLTRGCSAHARSTPIRLGRRTPRSRPDFGPRVQCS